ncbi:NAD(P)-binding domain-containing protein, partial [Staphylococcus pettenkoferi]|uniref:NAD(P)-binding domain-containing protein n=1 Tax=Staphylococcus pettenkoferi TaxID=170573 RepID=UPI0016424204
IMGGKKSGVDAGLEVEKGGGNVRVVYGGDHYGKGIKGWILPKLECVVRDEKIEMELNGNVTRMSEDRVV